MLFTILVLGIVFFACAIGLFAMFLPLTASRLYGIPADEKGRPFVVAMGARDVFLGVILLAIWRQEAPYLLGEFFWLSAIVSGTDAVMVFRRGDKKIALTHAIGAAAGIAIGIWILSFT